jgi:hypothetical protein
VYVRIARFEGADPDALDKQIGEIRSQIDESRQQMESGDLSGPEAQAMQAIKRGLMVVDREGGKGAGIQFAETEEDIRKIDAWMNSMSPGAGAGQRVSVDIYEVAIDQEGPG